MSLEGFPLAINLGYACINFHFSELPTKERITTNRSMIRKTFDQKGIVYAGELAEQNVLDLYKILQWNTANGIRFYRMSSDMFPWASEYGVYNLPNIERISALLRKCGEYATATNQRLTFHPGPFNKLTSSNPSVISNTIKDLTVHADVMDLMGLSRTHYNKINIHVGATYNDKPAAVAQFLHNFELLEEKISSRITLENDDKQALYTTQELYDLIYKHTNIPIVFDHHHHCLNNSGMSHKEAMEIAVSTWGDVKPVMHYSQSRSEEQNIKCPAQAHSDSYWQTMEDYGLNFDLMLECKHKEVGLFKYRELLKQGNNEH
jgi:UV DNA damage endonuclease